MKKKKGMMIWTMMFFLSVFLAGCVGGGEGKKDEIGVSEEASPGFDFTESFSQLNTKIVSRPPMCSTSDIAGFKFKCTGGVLPCKFKCNLDGQGWTKCKKAMTYPDLAEGGHTLQVYAIDATGKKDKTPEIYNWTIASFCCGDGVCSPGEDFNSCPSDCPPPVCGDGICSTGENFDNCPADCPVVCGDGICSAGENAGNCPSDCPIICGDGICSAGENVDNCPADCPPVCGDGICSVGENVSNCPSDCPVIETAQQITTGENHSCALTSEGAVKCWGDNYYGKLGNGTWDTSNVPIDVYGLSSGVRVISAGRVHTCALISGGPVKCWGWNLDGQLGNGTTVEYSNVPVNVSGLSSGIDTLDAGNYHNCALSSEGAVKCWGDNWAGQLGNKTWNDSNVPVLVDGLFSGVTAISAGFAHTCALTSQGAVKCWGHNGYGQLGNVSATSNVPVDVYGLSSGVIAISTGDNHTCALTSENALKCWGYNWYGQLGNGTTTDSNIPVDVSGLSSGIIAISAGGAHTCAVSSGGTVKCWGDNWAGQLGNGTNIDSIIPVDVLGLSSGAIAVSAGGYHTCVLILGGAVKCWGHNGYGQLGNGNWNTSNVPVNVIGFGS